MVNVVFRPNMTHCNQIALLLLTRTLLLLERNVPFPPVGFSLMTFLQLSKKKFKKSAANRISRA